MPRYYHEYSHYHQHRYIKRLKKLAIFLAVVFVIVGTVLLIDTIRQRIASQNASTTTEQTTAVIQPGINVFRTQYFQLQAPKAWQEVANPDQANRFLYVKKKGSVLEESLTVYVNSVPELNETTRVLPVDIRTGNEFEPGDISDHCRKALPPNTNTGLVQVTFEKVTFKCKADYNGYVVLVGQKGASNIISLLRPDGSTANYIIVYENVRFEPDPQDLLSIIKSFQAR